jgi:hypothetical protein
LRTYLALANWEDATILTYWSRTLMMNIWWSQYTFTLIANTCHGFKQILVCGYYFNIDVLVNIVSTDAILSDFCSTILDNLENIESNVRQASTQNFNVRGKDIIIDYCLNLQSNPIAPVLAYANSSVWCVPKKLPSARYSLDPVSIRPRRQ